MVGAGPAGGSPGAGDAALVGLADCRDFLVAQLVPLHYSSSNETALMLVHFAGGDLEAFCIVDCLALDGIGSTEAG